MKLIGPYARVVLVAISLGFISTAHASHWFKVSNAADLQWLIDQSGKVYLRNLKSFDSTVMDCCYNYWIDLSTPAGKGMWSSLQLKIATSESVWISVDNTTSAGEISFIGDID